MCSDLPLRVTISDENFLHDDVQLGSAIEGACTTVTVIGKTLGSAKVNSLYLISSSSWFLLKCNIYELILSHISLL
jgi:hypothetical protein